MDLPSNISRVNPGPVATSDAATFISTAFTIMVMFLTLLGNFTVFFSVACNKKLHSPTNYLICSLAVSDLLIGLLSLPFRLAQTLTVHWPTLLGVPGCQFWIWIDFLCCGASILNLTCISIDRLVSVVRPLHYKQIMTTTRVKFMILFVWSYAILFSSMSFIKWENDEHIVIVPQCSIVAKTYITVLSLSSFFIPFVILTFNYSIVLKIAINQARKLQTEILRLVKTYERQEQDHNMNAQKMKTTRSIERKKRSLARRYITSRLSFIKQLKATKTLAVVIGVFILCWFPFFVIFLTFQYCPDCFKSPRISSQTMAVLIVVFIHVLPVSNSAANPIIYSCCNTDFRKAFIFGIKSKLLRQTTTQVSSKTNRRTDTSILERKSYDRCAEKQSRENIT